MRLARSTSVAACIGIALGAIALTPPAHRAAHAAETAPVRATQTHSRLPDFRGIWESEPWAHVTEAGRPAGGIAAVRAKSALAAKPPYNAEWEARYQAGLKNTAALAAHGATLKVCALAFPGIMESPAVLQFFVTPEETLIVSVTQEVRHIYTDGRPHPAPEDLWPTAMGDSIGRWEGETLVIETIARRATAPIRYSSPLSVLSEQARFTERIRRVGADQLENEMTIEDPVALAHPWVLKLRYRRVAELDRMPSHDCTENDRNPVVDGKIVITPP